MLRINRGSLLKTDCLKSRMVEYELEGDFSDISFIQNTYLYAEYIFMSEVAASVLNLNCMYIRLYPVQTCEYREMNVFLRDSYYSVAELVDAV